MMTAAPIRWHAEAIWEALAPMLPGFTVEIVPCIDSTNSELMRRARAGDHAPTLLVAEQQTAGRGRMGKTWHSSTGDSLLFSLGMPLAPQDWSGLSLAVGATLAHALQPAPSKALALGLKWPNDLWVHGDRKLGGILIETAHTPGAPRQVIVGVGLNIAPRAADGLSMAPASLQELDPRWDAPGALAAVTGPLVACLQRFEAEGFAPFRAGFTARDVLHARAVQLSDGTHGVCEGVDHDGALLVRTAQGRLRVTSAEVSVRPALVD